MTNVPLRRRRDEHAGVEDRLRRPCFSPELLEVRSAWNLSHRSDR